MKKVRKKFLISFFVCFIMSATFSSCSYISHKEDCFGCPICWLNELIKREDYYEAHVEFFVSPYKIENSNEDNGQSDVYGRYAHHVMDNMIKLLSSESFSEFLIDGVESVGGQMKGTPIKYDEEENLTEEYKTFLKRVDEAVTFSYFDNEDIENLARSLIYVNISVKDDETFANSILENIITIVPWYVEQNMAVPAGFFGTKCEKTTTLEVVELVEK